VARVGRLNNFNNNSNFNASNRNIDNNNIRVRGIAQNSAETFMMKKPRDLWQELCAYKNLELAWKRARKHKTKKRYVIEFEKNLNENILMLRTELLLHAYRPLLLKTFILRDPKTRVISKSDFRDRVVHHALCNIIEPIFDKAFIYDSYANRKSKGTLAAIKRFEHFKIKTSRNLTKLKEDKGVKGFVLKADVRHYFDTVDHKILIKIIRKRINDKRIIWLIKTILSNYKTKLPGKGMPLGNLTSQFFANVYLNELDQYVKHVLKAKHYIRYVDDFVILHLSAERLGYYKEQINYFIKEKLALQLHSDKSKIHPLYTGTDFLGLRIYSHHRLLKKRNIRKFRTKLELMHSEYEVKKVNYDEIYDFLEGWAAYSKYANTFKLRRKHLAQAEELFGGALSTKEFNRYSKLTNHQRHNYSVQAASTH
jgi:retron-type reverse transcriptase